MRLYILQIEDLKTMALFERMSCEDQYGVLSK